MKKTSVFLATGVLLAGLLIFVSCHKNSDTTQSNKKDPPADQLVIASLQGRVMDENGLPVKDAVVASGTATTLTDVNGIFRFSNIQMRGRFGFVKVTKQGYFTGSRTIVTNPGANNFVRIDLLPRSSKGSFEASIGGAITVESGNRVSFGGGTIVNAASNAVYSGKVNVYATYLDPTATGMPAQMPGDLRGISLDNKETGMRSFGMMVVELEGDGGQKLQIASGKHATVIMQIPASLTGSAPSTIPLWYFNDSTGKWMEEGKANAQGNIYVGQVGHFSWWNCDIPSEFVNFKVHVKDQHGNPMAYTYLQFSSSEFGARGGYTDSSGYAQGMIPANTTFTFQVLNACNGVIFSENVSPAVSDQDLGTITVTTPGSLVLTGNVVDCNNNPVANGFVNVNLEGLNYRGAVINGSFTLAISRCEGATVQAQLTVGDYGTNQQGSVIEIIVSTGNLNVGQLTACGVGFDQFFTIVFNNSNYSLAVLPDSVSYNKNNDNVNHIWFTTRTQVNPYQSVFFSFTSPDAVGTYPIDYLTLLVGNKYYRSQGAGQCVVTGFGDTGGYVTGNISGNMVDSLDTNVTYPMTGSFKVKRNSF